MLVKASSVTNLTDARYFAAKEVNYLGFNLEEGSPGYLEPASMKAIREWIAGPHIVGEFENAGIDHVLAAIEFYNLDVVQLKADNHLKVLDEFYGADNAFTYNVEIEVVNPKQSPLLGGMHARASFTFVSNQEGLTVPRKTIAGSLQDPSVFVVANDSIAELRHITLGEIYGDRVEVKTGLKSGDKVVLTGQLNLSEGTKVQVVEGN